MRPALSPGPARLFRLAARVPGLAAVFAGRSGAGRRHVRPLRTGCAINSATHFTCANNGRNGFPVLESPNGNPDADTIISTTSHEVNESITDPEGTAWFDAIGFEIGDECNFVFGPTNGVAGQLYNQIMNGHHYITQEEFSNKDFAVTGLGCKQGEKERNRP